jgi:hypothetical protein
MLKRALSGIALTLSGIALIAILSSCSSSPKSDNPISRTGMLAPSAENTAAAVVTTLGKTARPVWALTGVTPERVHDLMGKVIRVNGTLSKRESNGLPIIMVHDIDVLDDNHVG